jgi:hypothetical protein
MRVSEWRSPKGGLACAVILIFLAYLVVPDRGLGGSEARIRLSWGVFLWGGILACSVRRLRFLQVPLAVYLSILLLGTLISTKTTLAETSRAVEDYLPVANQIPQGARLVRLRYPTPGIPQQYGFGNIGRDPVFHVDSLIAARCKCIDLTDYQAPSSVFPIIFRPAVDRGQQYVLWGLEGSHKGISDEVAWLRSSLPVPIDYLILVSDDAAQKASDPEYVDLLSKLDAGMRLIATSPATPFVRLYMRVGAR